MTKKTLYILRHGETEYNRLGIVQGSGVDTELNDIGHKQAEAFFEAHKNIDFQLVVTSKLIRTHQTVRHFLDRNIPWIQTPDINEISWGAHEGKPSTPERIAIYRRMIGEWKSGNLDASLPEGETARQLRERVGRFIEWVRVREEQRILVATHGRTLRCLVTMLKGLDPAQMEQVSHANTGLYLIHLHEGNWIFELENDIRHLEDLRQAI
ncbi:MAG: histidine phosphatase family protein [Lewinellaceae bacterium]|nr:histidine phosphatase family protein [Saprospiraceae bacterium]MCB9305476.1 histidine phosphatase family protein [Lewinellaceae bacterium]MCB9356104.1 histidine phosphatase family protein [Lewinellaceae bacterium]